MALSAGTKLGPYEVLAPLGAGGMGEVYRARDTRLGRDVAIKVLPEHLSTDTDLKARFEREAKAISSLNHPHICHLYDIGSQDGTDYLVMELLEGETLADRLQRGAIPFKQALEFGIHISSALEKAHRSGIMHRDLKPGNIMLTKSGAKLMDFGLAKPVPSMTAMASGSIETMSKPLTGEGKIVGTYQYMAPEQIHGKNTDARTDIFALGAVLYEMVTGKRAFQGKSQISVMSAILEKEPEPASAVQPLTPPALDHVIQRALAKDPEERWQTVHDLMQELRWAAESGERASGRVPAIGAAKRTRERLRWLTVGALAVLLIAAVIWWRNPKPPEEAMYFSAPFASPVLDMAVAPNGHTVAVVTYREAAGKNMISIYELGSEGLRILANTEGAGYPFWSPDGRSLAFFADAKLKRVEIAGGPVQTLCDAPGGRGGTWNRDGVILFTPDASPGGGIYRVPASGGTPILVSSPDAKRGEQSHRWPMFLPDGNHFLYMAANFDGRPGVDAIYVGALDSKEKQFLAEATANPAYAAPGYLLYYRDKTLFAQRFDAKGLGLSGPPTIIQTEVQYLPQVAKAAFAVSDNGVLVSQTGGGVAVSQLVWVSRKGTAEGTVASPDVYGNVSLSPDGKSVAIDKADVGSLNADVWTYELQRQSWKRLTFGPGYHFRPSWNPDSTRLVFGSNRQQGRDVYVKNSDGSQEEESIVQDDTNKFPDDWSRDGKYVLYNRETDLWFVTLPELKSHLFLKAPSVIMNAQFSPDGKWVAYASNETGKWEVYVTSFPAARGKWQISTASGEQPRWRGDGKELFFLSSDGKMMATPVTTGEKFDAGTPVPLFQASPRQIVSSTDAFSYDVARDGQRFLINTPVKQADSAPMSVILNWPARLKK